MIGIKSEQDILDISEILSLLIKKYDLENILITDTIQSFYLKKIDEELWNKFNPNQKYLLNKVRDEIIIINKGRIKFILKGDGDYNYPEKIDTFGKKYIEEIKKSN